MFSCTPPSPKKVFGWYQNMDWNLQAPCYQRKKQTVGLWGTGSCKHHDTKGRNRQWGYGGLDPASTMLPKEETDSGAMGDWILQAPCYQRKKKQTVGLWGTGSCKHHATKGRRRNRQWGYGGLDPASTMLKKEAEETDSGAMGATGSSMPSRNGFHPLTQTGIAWVPTQE